MVRDRAGPFSTRTGTLAALRHDIARCSSASSRSTTAWEVRNSARSCSAACAGSSMLAAAASIELPAQAAEQLRAEFLTSQAVVLLLDAELQRAMSCLRAASVPVLVLKGPALSRTIYPDRAL